MDRQPLTDRLGDRLLAEYGGAAAAYSLRALNGNGDSVVRVRRASDNDEKDFTAEQIELGEMVNWVNSQTVPPLDIGVETSEGRIPVPEGGTSIGTPAAAYSLRNLSTTYTGNVVDVRRSSDDAVESFTAEEVSDGTLEAWVNGNWENVSYSTFTNGESWEDGFTAINTTSSSAGLRIPSGTTGDVITISFNLTLNSGTPSPSISLRPSAGGSISSNIEVVSTAGSHSVTLTATGSYSHITIGESDVPSGFSISNVILNVVPNPIFDGFVSKWYDQSGNDNHATQGTAASQPKIVDGGSLVSGGLDFDGVDDLLIGTHNVTSAYNFFSVTTDEGSAISYIADTGSGFTTGVNYGRTVNSGGNRKLTLSHGGFSSVNATGFLVGTELISQSYDGTTINAFVDGSLVGTSVQGYTASGTSLSLGSAGSTSAFLNGKMAEIILYPSDQSANRTAIEANIGETYGITGIPAYDNTVDGFVETWYDQSGNGNDATQSVAASQPKIVDGGVLVSGGLDFDGVDDRLTCPSLYSSDISIFNVATTSNTVNTGNYMRMVHLCDGSDSFQLTRGGSTEIGKLLSKNTAFQSGAPGFRHGDINGINLISAVTSSTDTDAFIDGSLQSNGSLTLGSGNSTTTTIGARDDLLSSGFFAGSHAEIIIYPSDQSANRPAIETNINDHYNIY